MPEMEKPNSLTSADSQQWTIQEATFEHLDALVWLEEACFTAPWSRKSFEAELRGNQFSRVRMISHPSHGHEVKVIAYICAWMVFEEIRFLNVAVHPDFRRQGIAKQLIRDLLHLGVEAGCCRGLLEVRASNGFAKNLYESFHFHAHAIRKSYYTNPTEDAILMTLEPLVSLETERREQRNTSIV